MILLPAPGDNAAIATRRLAAGEGFAVGKEFVKIRGAVLEGHRVAVRLISAGEPIYSWGLPFARALRAIEPGDYLCNARILEALRGRSVDFEIPREANFENFRLKFEIDESKFRAGEQVATYKRHGTFDGYPRGERGAGTRNFVVVLATSSRANSVARTVAAKFKDAKGVDGVVAVAHTEGGGPSRPNNYELVVRTLNGFLRNPNVGAFVAIDDGDEPVNNRGLVVKDPPGAFVSIAGNFDRAVSRASEEVARLLSVAATARRASVPIAHLKIGLQCGGSDAFSGVSGNPLVGWMARETIRNGGVANLAETDELIGAESYVLANVRDLATARAFLDKVARFQERAAWHGHSAEGNPSGGNLFRGLYNITIKSIGAAMKKSPDTRLDYVIDYGDPMPQPGFYFMDSPGNDLESIAGQVASGCNVILFATGNGSITNFPFVPTIKVMTTTGRFKMLEREMDVNAGRYLDGELMDKLGDEAFALMLRIASGERSAGEKAGHAQTQIWRDWRQTAPGADLKSKPVLGTPVDVSKLSAIEGLFEAWESPTFQALRTPRGWASNAINLIVPTSLCSGQISLMIADAVSRQSPLRCVALPHTEGCGNSGGESERLMLRTLAGYAIHPLAHRTLMLEHGCEKTHNDAFRHVLSADDAKRLGWLSIQLDGGIQPVIQKALNWFAAGPAVAVDREAAPISALRIGFVAVDATIVSTQLPVSLAKLGALVVIPENSTEFAATIDYGQPAPSHGLHVMRAPTDHLGEIITGLGATGVELIVLINPAAKPLQHHPFIPVLEIAELPQKTEAARDLLSLILRAASGESANRSETFADFQITRGLEGLSL